MLEQQAPWTAEPSLQFCPTALKAHHVDGHISFTSTPVLTSAHMHEHETAWEHEPHQYSRMFGILRPQPWESQRKMHSCWVGQSWGDVQVGSVSSASFVTAPSPQVLKVLKRIPFRTGLGGQKQQCPVSLHPLDPSPPAKYLFPHVQIGDVSDSSWAEETQ